jgi:DegV family protein with EDD domain
MRDYVIITDSTADLPLEIIEKLNIDVIPMAFDMGDKNYTHYPDEREIKIHDFYDRLKNGENSVTTQINYFTYKESFDTFLKDGKDILYIAFSSGLSGTYNSSQLVIKELKEEYPERKIISVDSLSASIGEGLLVYNAVMKKEEGMTMEELVKWIEEHRNNMCHWFTVEDLHHLKRGGRISSVEAIIGTTLKIKPVLSVDDEGKLVNVTKVRGDKKSLEKLLDKMIEDGTNLKDQTIIIGHGDSLERAEYLANLIREKKLVNDIIINTIGPIIGTHTGQGMIGLTFMGNKNLK